MGLVKDAMEGSAEVHTPIPGVETSVIVLPLQFAEPPVILLGDVATVTG